MNFDTPYISQLKSRLRKLQERFTVILQSSQLERYVRQSNPFASISALGSNHPKSPEIKLRWIQLPPELEREQNQILKDFEEWHADFIRLFSNATRDEANQLKQLYLEMDTWIKYRSGFKGVPDSPKNAIALFEATCAKFISFLDQFPSASDTSVIFVIDTSAIIDCPDVSQISRLINAVKATFIFPSTTISELDDLKTGKRDENFRRRLKTAINHLSEMMTMGNIREGIELSNGIIVKMLATEPNFSNLPKWLDPSINDDRIVASAIELQRSNPKSSIAILANDLNMQNKGGLAGIPVMKVPVQLEDAA
jgi:hypothetical protein